MAPITLPSQEYLRQCFDYDPETGILRWRERPREHFRTDRGCLIFNWRFAGKAAGTLSKRGYVGVHLRGHPHSMMAHRIAWKMQTGDDTPLVEHEDKDPSNNAWSNLRVATQSQNCCNTPKRSRRKCPELPKGVCQKRGRFTARVTFQRTNYNLGCFDTPEEAHEAYCAKAKEIHGEFWHP